MTMSYLWNAITTDALITHLWQSTVFAVLAWLLTLALRNYPARVRFSVWMAASIKFLVPFALLTALGNQFAAPNSRPPVTTTFYTVIEEINRPFTSNHPLALEPRMPVHSLQENSWLPLALAGIWLFGCALMLLRWARQWQHARRLVKAAAVLEDGREVDALRRAEARVRIRKHIPVVVVSKSVEPGVFGVMQPVLLWPAGLSERMDDAQISSIVAHELEHVCRRDNLTATVHALVEGLFWFHPGLRWMGVKMQEERERACDEKVIEQSAEARTYAESILTVCTFCLESPSPCIAGVSGSDLKKRIGHIMSRRRGAALTVGRTTLLIAAAVLAVALPIGFGVVHGQSTTGNPGTPGPEAAHEVPQFDVSSIKPTSPGSDERSMIRITPDGTLFRGTPVHMLLRTAFGVEDDRIFGEPSWVKSNRYDIEAKVAPEDAPKLDKLKAEDRGAMLIPLLTERFGLKYHHETRELPMYALVVAKGGPKLTSAAEEPGGDQPPSPFGGPAPKGIDSRGRMMMGPGHIESQDTTIAMLVHSLAPQLGHSVIDKTGLTGRYDYVLQWTPDNASPPMMGGPGGAGGPPHTENAADAAPVSLFTAIQEQLGLKLEAEKGSVDVIVIDHIDPPSPN